MCLLDCPITPFSVLKRITCISRLPKITRGLPLVNRAWLSSISWEGAQEPLSLLDKHAAFPLWSHSHQYMFCNGHCVPNL